METEYDQIPGPIIEPCGIFEIAYARVIDSAQENSTNLSEANLMILIFVAVMNGPKRKKSD